MAAGGADWRSCEHRWVVAHCMTAFGSKFSCNDKWISNYFILYLPALLVYRRAVRAIRIVSYSFPSSCQHLILATNFYLPDFCQSELTFSYICFFFFSSPFRRIIVGAPLADTSRIQPGVVRGGAVYRCDIAEDNRCRIIPFDSQGKQSVCHFFIIPSPNLLTPTNKSDNNKKKNGEETQVEKKNYH